MENVPLLCDFAAATMLIQEWFFSELGLTGHSLSDPPADAFNFVSAQPCEQSPLG